MDCLVAFWARSQPRIFDVDDRALFGGDNGALADLDALPAAVTVGIRLGFAGQHFREVFPLVVGSVAATREIDFSSARSSPGRGCRHLFRN
jgi:hypothetical protein